MRIATKGFYRQILTGCESYTTAQSCAARNATNLAAVAAIADVPALGALPLRQHVHLQATDFET